MKKQRLYLGVGAGAVAAIILVIVFLQVFEESTEPRELMDVMTPDRSFLEGEVPFSLNVTLSKEAPISGDDVEITATVKSETAPHTRTQILFFIDGEKVEGVTGVIPPFQTGSTTYTWVATQGNHVLRVEVASPVGVTYDSWEKTFEIPTQ